MLSKQSPGALADGDTSDHVLVDMAQKGDYAAFGALWLRYASKIRSVASRFVREPADAEDLTQETFLKAYIALSNYRGESQFYSWLYKIAFNTSINFYHAKARCEYTNVELIDQPEPNHPENIAISKENRKVVLEAINLMPSGRREALTLNTYNGHSYKTISAMLHCPVGTVRSRISRAREDLAVALQA